MIKEDTNIDLDFGTENLVKHEESNEIEDGEITDDSFDYATIVKEEKIEEPKIIEIKKYLKKPYKPFDFDSPSKCEKRGYSRTLYIGDLNKTINDEKLTAIFGKYGEIVDIDIKYLRFGVATYAFIQYVDPVAAIEACKNQQHSIVDGARVKIGYGRANIFDMLCIGGFQQSDLQTILDTIQTYNGFVWSLTDKNLTQTLIKFESLNDSTNAHEKIKEIKLSNILVDYMSLEAAKKFIIRMEKSGQVVNEAILRDFSPEKNPKVDSNELKESKKSKSSDEERPKIRHSDRDKRDRHERIRPPSVEDRSRKRRNISPRHTNHVSEKRKSVTPEKNKRTHAYENDKILKIWNGELALKRKNVGISFYFLKGNRRVFDACLLNMTKGNEKIKSLKIEHRMVLDDEQFSLINNRIKNEDDSGFAIAVLNDKDEEQLFKENFVNYFTDKNAAGVINIHDSKHHHMTHVIYTFPTCSFTRRQTKEANGELKDIMSKNTYLLILALRCQ